MPISAPSVLLLGPTGTGKTHSLATIIEAGLELFVIVTEPNGLDTLLDAVPSGAIDKLHYKVIPPARPGFDTLFDMSKKISIMNYEALSKMVPTNRTNAQFLQVVDACRNFTCDRTGEVFGSFETFDASRAVAIDSLSGISLMAMDLTIGDKVTAHQGEWGVAMGILEKFLLGCTSNLNCLFTICGHIERETDELTQGTKLMASTLGRKLAPKIPRFFSEVVLCSTEGKNYFWNTEGLGVDLKHRALPLASKLAPNFAPVINKYNERLKLTGGNSESNVAQTQTQTKPATTQTKQVVFR